MTENTQNRKLIMVFGFIVSALLPVAIAALDTYLYFQEPSRSVSLLFPASLQLSMPTIFAVPSAFVILLMPFKIKWRCGLSLLSIFISIPLGLWSTVVLGCGIYGACP